MAIPFVGKMNGFHHAVVTGAGLALGAVITLGIIKIVTRATGIGHEFSYEGMAQTQNVLRPDATSSAYYLR